MSKYDRQASERALIEAVGTLIAREGFSGLGVNAIARESGVNKSLIYRYFDGLDGLYVAFVNSNVLWPTTQDLLGDVLEWYAAEQWREALVELQLLYARELRARPNTIELLAWECVERNALTIAFEEVRERRSIELSEAVAAHGFEPPIDLRPAIAMLASGIHYLLIRSRNINVFGGARVSSDAFWEDELRGVVEALVRGL